jgi:hypothetical protein
MIVRTLSAPTQIESPEAGVSKLRSWRHEKFAQEIAAGTNIKEAYLMAGFAPSSVVSRNYNRLLRRPDVAERVAELKQAREDMARAAGGRRRRH